MRSFSFFSFSFLLFRGMFMSSAGKKRIKGLLCSLLTTNLVFFSLVKHACLLILCFVWRLVNHTKTRIYNYIAFEYG